MPSLSESDLAFAAATAHSAVELDALGRAGLEFGEKKHQAKSFKRALRLATNLEVANHERNLPLPNWHPRPEGVDAEAIDPSTKSSWVAELKVWDIKWSLWDTYKMVDALNVEGIEAAYLVGVWTDKQWQRRDGRCAELFCQSGVFDSLELFRRNAWAWNDTLWGGSARPTRIPAAIEIKLIAIAPCTYGNKPGSQRCIRVSSASDDWIPFSGDWPEGVEPYSPKSEG